MNSQEGKKFEQNDFIIENNTLKGATKQIDLSRKVGQHIFNTLNENPQHVSQINAETGEQTTFAEMRERSVRCALWMEKQQIGCDDIVVVCTDNHLDSYIPVFATFFIDAIFSTWYYQSTLYSARQLMKQYKPKLIFACQQISDVLFEASRLENVSTKIVVFGEHPRLQNMDEILRQQRVEEIEKFVPKSSKSLDDMAAIMFSSGTTGLPKGMMLSNKYLLYLTKESSKILTKNRRTLWYSTLDWMSCLNLMLRCTFEQGTRILDSRSDTENFCRTIEKYQVHFTFISPYQLNCLAKFDAIKNYNLTSLKVILTTGGRVHESVFEDIRRKLPLTTTVQAYGLTEIGTTTRPDQKAQSMNTSGFIRPNYQLKIVDLTTNRNLGPNEEGEIRVLSPAPMIGYYEQPEKTRECYDEQGWFRTGDLGYYNENGEIFMTGRLKDTMKYRNRQISPLNIERVLMRHPDVEEVAVVAVPHELDGDWPAAFVKTIDGTKINKEELLELTARLEDHNKLRGGLYFMDSLPKTSSGKIKKNNLSKIAEDLIKKKQTIDCSIDNSRSVI